MPDFDVVVLGGGTAGTRVAGELARAGRKVALVDDGESPGFARLPAASLLHSARRGETWEHAIARRDELTRRWSGVPAEAGVTVLPGRGRVVRAGAVEADGAEHGYADLVLCTGSEPVRTALPGLAEVPTWTGDEALGRPGLPRRLVVLGGDPAGCELAQVYAAYGAQVTVVAEQDRLLAAEAPFIGAAVGAALLRMGVDLRLGVRLDLVDQADAGFRLWLRPSHPAEPPGDGGVIDADRLLIAAAERKPRLDDLGLEVLGIDPDAGLTADPTGQVAHRVWAAGDVTGGPPCPHTAAYQAEIVAANILGTRREADYRAIPRAVYTMPAAYAVGVPPVEGDLVSAGCDLSEIARAALHEDDRGRVELYADRSRGVLAGAAAVGPYAEEWMSEVALAIRAEIPLGTLADVVRPYPTYGEAIGIAVRELIERLSGREGST